MAVHCYRHKKIIRFLSDNWTYAGADATGVRCISGLKCTHLRTRAGARTQLWRVCGGSAEGPSEGGYGVRAYDDFRGCHSMAHNGGLTRYLLSIRINCPVTISLHFKRGLKYIYADVCFQLQLFSPCIVFNNWS